MVNRPARHASKVLFGLLLFLFPLVCVAQTGLPSLSFDAVLRPSGPILFQGKIETHREPFAAEGNSFNQEYLVRRANLSGLVFETKWHTIGDPDDTKGVPTQKKSGSWRLGSLNEADVRIEAVAPEASWAQVSRFPFDEFSSASGATCTFASEPRIGFQFEGRQEKAPAVAPWERPPNDVVATCTAGSFATEGRPDLFVFGVHLNIRYQRPKTESPDPTTADASAVLDLVTGTIVSPNQTLPGVYDHVHRVLQIIPQGPDAFLPLNTSGPWTLRSPVVTVGGELGIPPARGNVTWGDWNATDPVEPLGPRGLFELSAQAGQGMAVEGLATNGPPSAIQAPRERGDPPDWVLPTTTAALALLLAALAARPRFWLLALFSRLTQDATLNHPRRRAILACIEANPGISIQNVAQKLFLPRRAVKYHLQVMGRLGLVQSRRQGREIGLYSKTFDLAEHAGSLWGLSRPLVQRLLAAITSLPTGTHADLAREVGVTRSYVSKILQRLKASGIIVEEREADRRSYRVLRS